MINNINLDGSLSITPGRYGNFLYLKGDAYIGKSLEAYGEWSQGEVDLFSKIVGKDDVVIEAGSNIGTHTIPLARIAKRVYAFEAQPVICQILCANIAINGLHNVVAHNIAAGDSECFIQMPDYDYTSNENWGGIRAYGNTTGAYVKHVTLDGFLKLDSLKLLKADVEDMEMDVIRGATGLIERFRPVIYLEINHDAVRAKEMQKMLLAMNYTIHPHNPNLFNPSNFKDRLDNIFPDGASFNILCLPSEHEFPELKEYL